MISMLCAAVEDPDDREFLVTLYDRYDKLLWSTVRTFCADPNAWEDIVQETLLRLIPKAGVLREMDPKARAGYIRMAARNTAFIHLRAAARERERTVSLETVNPGALEDEAPGLEELLVAREDPGLLRSIWPKLSEEDRFLLESRFLLEESSAALAQILGCKQDSIRTKVRRARKRAARLAREEGEEG